jgi:tetratricopeptide (TPR) repeat protein
MSARVIALIICLTAVLPALAAPVTDNFSKGCAFYNKGQYDKALAYLQDTVSKKPRSWQGHYWLGHNYLALGQRTEAYEQYQLCRACNPPAQIAASCVDMAGRLAARPTAPRPIGSTNEDAYRNQNLERMMRQKQEIYNQSAENALREVENQRLRIDNAQNSNAVNGLQRMDAPMVDQNHGRDLEREAAMKGKQIMDDAKRRADAIRYR